MGTCTMPISGDVPEGYPELFVRDNTQIVVQPDEDGLGIPQSEAAGLLLEQALPDRIDQRGDVGEEKEHQKGDGEQRDRPAPVTGARVPARLG